MQSLKSHRHRDPAFADLLNYAAVIDDGIILNKDGSLMAAWYYRGQDLATVSYAERNRISAHINAAFIRLGSEWCLHQDAIRIESRQYPHPEESHFPDFITRLIDEERRLQFESEGTHYENIYVLTLTYRKRPSRTMSSRLRLVAARMRTSARRVTGSPTRSYSLS